MELTCSLSDAWLSLAMILQLYKYIAKQDYVIFSSASCGWNDLIMMDCMALSNNNNLRIKSKHVYLALRFEGCIWIKKIIWVYWSFGLMLCTCTSMEGHFSSDPSFLALFLLPYPGWIWPCYLYLETTLMLAILFISLVRLMANGTQQ